MCTLLEERGYRNTVASGRRTGQALSEPFTDHMWSHTWIDGAQKVVLEDTAELELGEPIELSLPSTADVESAPALEILARGRDPAEREAELNRIATEEVSEETLPSKVEQST